MKTIGIVAEYNPFHLGHALQIRESRRRAQSEGEETALIAVMSGDFVQRGLPQRGRIQENDFHTIKILLFCSFFEISLAI